MKYQPHRFAVAPMMDWTDRHCRAFHRILTRNALLFTEMVTAEAVIHGDRERLLGFSPVEHPVALQLGGSDPAKLADAARIGADWGYDEINLNVGCPSDRVQSGRFGACLMAEPALVADCVTAMRDGIAGSGTGSGTRSDAGRIPVTVKCRIGIDDQDSEADLNRFIDTVADAGCERLTVHARKAWLKGLSPKQNREVPPLDYARVYRLKDRRPDLTIILNGGITSIEQSLNHLQHVDGVMLGRAAYQAPYLLSEVDRAIFGETQATPLTREQAFKQLRPYIAQHLETGGRLHNVLRHTLGLFQGKPGARAFRRFLSENGVGPDAGLDVFDAAVDFVDVDRDRTPTSVAV